MNRRGFCRALGGLACVGLGGCKIEPILDLDSDDLALDLAFPELPPQIPDQLADAETVLRVLTEQLLEREARLLSTGGLLDRPSEKPANAVTHFVELMREFGLEPAGHRGGWQQSVMLDIVEPTGADPRVVLRPERQAPAEQPEAPTEPPESPPAEQPEAPPESSPESPPESPPAEQPEAPPIEPPPSRALDLAEHGAFRQRGEASPHTALLLGKIRSYETPLSTQTLAGRVAVFRAPADLDLADPEAPAHVDLLMSSVRDAGVLGCLLLTRDDGPGIARFRTLWHRQIRRSSADAQALLIEGVLGKQAEKLLREAVTDDETFVLDVDLGTRGYEVETFNVLGRLTGRERPDEAVVLTCPWDTPDPLTSEVDTLRLLTSLATFHQLAEWSRRTTPPRYSLVLLLTVDAGFAIGQSVHATWSTNFGAEIKALLALDRPTIPPPLPAVVLSGHYDPDTAEDVRRVVAADGRDLLLEEQLSMPSLAPYLRYPAPVMTIGAPSPEVVDEQGLLDAAAENAENAENAEAEGEAGPEPFEGIHADVRLLRNLLLALAAHR